MNNPALAQQLASGKAQLATINGQQVLLRNTSTGNLVQLNSANAGIIVRNAVTPTKTQTGKSEFSFFNELKFICWAGY